MDGKILKKLRLEHELTQEQLAKKIEVSPSTIRMIELGKRDGSKKVVEKIADFFDVSLDFLNKRTDKRNIEESAIDDFLDKLVEEGIISDPNNIDNETAEMILNAVKSQIAYKMMKKGKR